MTTTQLPADLAAGDKVAVRRNLSHPAWNDRTENEYGDIVSTLREGITEDLGLALVTDRREISAIPGGPGFGREAKTLIRVAGGLWYDLATGLQDGSEATYITAAIS